MKPRIREHLRNAQTLSLTRDARRQRLLIRFGSCDGKGNSHAGILGLVRDFGDNAGEIVKATRHILKRVCTSWGRLHGGITDRRPISMRNSSTMFGTWLLTTLQFLFLNRALNHVTPFVIGSGLTD